MGTLQGSIAQENFVGDARRVAGTLVLGLVEANELIEHNELAPSVVSYMTNAIVQVIAESYSANSGTQPMFSSLNKSNRWRRELTCLCFMLDPENNSIPKESNGYLMGLHSIRTNAMQVANEVFHRARIAAKSEVRIGEFTNDEMSLELRRRQINDYIHDFGHGLR